MTRASARRLLHSPSFLRRQESSIFDKDKRMRIKHSFAALAPYDTKVTLQLADSDETAKAGLI